MSAHPNPPERKIAFWETYRFWALATCFVTVLVWSSCGADEFNVFRPLSESSALKSDMKAKLEQARVLLDKKKYDDALSLLAPMIADPDQDSNDARLYFAAAKLGVSQLDIWSVIKNIVNGLGTGSGSASTSGTGSSGFDQVLNKVTDSLIGTGENRAARIQALADSVTVLVNAPDPNSQAVRNTSCILAAFLTVPTVADATTALNGTLTALSQIKDAATSGGAECPNIGLLDASTSSVLSSVANFNLIVSVAKNCPFIDVSQATTLMNSVESSLNQLKTVADKGCASIPSTCPASVPDCQALFPACVQEVLKVGTSDAVAGDGRIDSCELVLNCTDPAACFTTSKTGG